jgi:hypothetical protein
MGGLEAAMSVQAEGTEVAYDPTITGVTSAVPSPAAAVPGVQGTFFGDGSSYRTFADTDQIPIVQSDGWDSRYPRPKGRWLVVLVAALALLVVLAGAALGLVQAGVLGNNASGHAATTSAKAASSTPAPAHRATSAPHKAALLTQTSTGGGSATYRVMVPAYGLTVTTTTGRAWVSVGAQGQRPLFAGIVNAHSTQHFTILGPTQVEIGAGGTSVTVTSNKRSQTLMPPSAPFNYTLTTS